MVTAILMRSSYRSQLLHSCKYTAPPPPDLFVPSGPLLLLDLFNEFVIHFVPRVVIGLFLVIGRPKINQFSRTGEFPRILKTEVNDKWIEQEHVHIWGSCERPELAQSRMRKIWVRRNSVITSR